MVRHQAIRMHCTSILNGEFAQVRQVHEVVRVFAEARGAVVPTLDHVNRDARQDQSEGSGHARNNDAALPALT